MHEDDGPRVRPVRAVGDDGVGAGKAPVLAVEIPDYRRREGPARGEPRVVVEVAIGRSQHGRGGSAARPDGGERVPDLCLERPGVEPGQLLVVLRVRGDLRALVLDRLHEAGVRRSGAAQTEERGTGVVLAEDVEVSLRIGAGSVVEGERDDLGAVVGFGVDALDHRVLGGFDLLLEHGLAGHVADAVDGLAGSAPLGNVGDCADSLVRLKLGGELALLLVGLLGDVRTVGEDDLLVALCPELVELSLVELASVDGSLEGTARALGDDVAANRDQIARRHLDLLRGNDVGKGRVGSHLGERPVDLHADRPVEPEPCAAAHDGDKDEKRDDGERAGAPRRPTALGTVARRRALGRRGGYATRTAARRPASGSTVAHTLHP